MQRGQDLGCDCDEVWTPYRNCEATDEVSYLYYFLVSPNCAVHWQKYLDTIEEMKLWKTP